MQGQASGLAFGFAISRIFDTDGTVGLILLREFRPMKPENFLPRFSGSDEGWTMCSFPLTITSFGSWIFSGRG